MGLELVRDTSGRTFRLAGELDLAVSGEFMRTLQDVVQGDGDLQLDVAALQFIDSSGIRALITLCQELEGRGRVILQFPTGEVAKVLEIVKADTLPNLVIEERPRLR